MRISLFLLIAISGLFANCGTNSKNLKSTSNTIIENDALNYEVVTTKSIKHSDPLPIPELRIYDVDSSRDGMALMYSLYGKWTEAKDGKYQDKNQELIWSEVVFPFSEEKFRVEVDGSETQEDFFSSIVVYDSNYYLALEESHPKRQALIDFFVGKMNEVNLEEVDYTIFNTMN